MTSPSRIPKGSKEGGQFMPKWAVELRENVEFQATWLKHVDIALAEHTNELDKLSRTTKDHIKHLWESASSLSGQLGELSSRLGTSTPLIIWNIAVLIAIAYLYCKAYVPGTP